MTAAITVIIFTCCAVRWLAPPWTCNHDVAWFLDVAGRLLDGQRLYVDVIDLNPPLIVYLSTIPVAAARALGTSEVLMMHVFVLISAAASVALTARALGRLDICRDRPRRAVAMLSLVYVMTVLPGGDLGQREHLLVMWLTPWIAVTAARSAGTRTSVTLALTAGALAGVGLSLKPHLTLGPALALAWTARRGGWRAVRTPENAALAAALTAYAAHFFLLPGDVVAGMLDVFGDARATYSGYDRSASALLFDPLVMECALLGGAALLLPQRGDARTLGVVLGWVWVGALAAALWQQKGWSYHLLPAATAGRLIMAIAAIGVLRHRARVWSIAAAAVITAIIGLELTERRGSGVDWSKPRREWLDHSADVARLAAGGPVLVLDTDIAPHYPALVHAGLRSTSRFGCLWQLPGLADAPATDRRPIEQRLRSAVNQDIQLRPPELVIIARAPVLQMGAEFDLEAWLRRDQRFDEFWRGLEVVAETPRWRFMRPRR